MEVLKLVLSNPEATFNMELKNGVLTTCPVVSVSAARDFIDGILGFKADYRISVQGKSEGLEKQIAYLEDFEQAGDIIEQSDVAVKWEKEVLQGVSTVIHINAPGELLDQISASILEASKSFYDGLDLDTSISGDAVYLYYAIETVDKQVYMTKKVSVDSVCAAITTHKIWVPSGWEGLEGVKQKNRVEFKKSGLSLINSNYIMRNPSGNLLQDADGDLVFWH